jgi:hypothetical protein
MLEITHQHLSNIYYYTYFTMAAYYPQSVREDVLWWLRYRFDGVILPYQPVKEFEFEKFRLIQLGALQANGDIIVLGEKVGKYPE